ncbi:hypothetical protein U1Q18_046133, partial [Sarracenia purpurea var. burkii]
MLVIWLINEGRLFHEGQSVTFLFREFTNPVFLFQNGATNFSQNGNPIRMKLRRCHQSQIADIAPEMATRKGAGVAPVDDGARTLGYPSWL